MKRVFIGMLAGIVLGLIDVLTILPVPLPNKSLVLLGAFSNRFTIGLFSATTTLGFPGWLQGACIGFLISILPAVTNPGFALFILSIGAAGGLLTRIATDRLTQKRKSSK